MLLYSAYRESLPGLPPFLLLPISSSLVFQLSQPTSKIAGVIFVLIRTVLASPPAWVQPQGRPKYIEFAAGPLAFAALNGSMTGFPRTEFPVMVEFRNTKPFDVRLSVAAAVIVPPLWSPSKLIVELLKTAVPLEK